MGLSLCERGVVFVSSVLVAGDVLLEVVLLLVLEFVGVVLCCVVRCLQTAHHCRLCLQFLCQSLLQSLVFLFLHLFLVFFLLGFLEKNIGISLLAELYLKEVVVLCWRRRKQWRKQGGKLPLRQ